MNVLNKITKLSLWCILMHLALNFNSVLAQSTAKTLSIGTTAAPNSSAVLDVVSTGKGVLLPRVNLTASNLQIGSVANATGLLVYNTGNATLPAGFYFWNGSLWRSFETVTSAAPVVTGLNCAGATLSPGSFQATVAYSGTLTVPYFGGNGAVYNGGTSTTINGLTFTLQSGKLNNGNGNLIFNVSGTPTVSSEVTVPMNSTLIPFFTGTACNAIVGTRTVINVGESVTGIYTMPTNAPNNTLLSASNSLPILDGLRMDLMKFDANYYYPRIYNTSAAAQVISYQTFATQVNQNKTALNVSLASNAFENIDVDLAVFWTTTAAEVVTTNLQVAVTGGYRWYEFKWWAMEIGTNKVIFLSVTRKA